MFVVPIRGRPTFDDVLPHSNIQISYHGDLCTSCPLTFVVSSNQPIREEISSFSGILLDWILATTSSSPTHVLFMYVTMRRGPGEFCVFELHACVHLRLFAFHL